MSYKRNKENLHKEYWESKYKNNTTGWDIGHISTPIKEYIDQLHSKKLKILIPGAGNSYEAEYLFKHGFKNITVLDIAEQPLLNISKRIPEFPKENLIKQDFFEHSNTYDLIIEQTFFCALDPCLRVKYAKKINNLLFDKGKLAGLLFVFELTDEGPPFGGSFTEYQQLFSPYLNIKTLNKCYNSLKPRFDKELFFIFEKK